MRLERASIWWLLAVGVLLRCAALTHPLLDAHAARQCQTAAATASIIEQDGFALSARIPWAGDLNAYYVQEIPIYNYLAIVVHFLIGNVDISGKLVSIALWTISFILLQRIWRRLLTQDVAFWANVLFVLAPLGVFYGQAFMPEMLVQSLAFAFLLLLLRYNERATLTRWIALASIGLLALLTKLPEVSHLYLILAVLLFRAEGWKALLRPRYLVAALFTIVALRSWSVFVDSVNQPYLPEWTSAANLRTFVGTVHDRLLLKRWIMACFYLGAFVFSGIAFLPAAFGFWKFLREKGSYFLGLWLLSLIAFYLLWFGNGPGSQSYYNLPALAPLCALFGIGMSHLLARVWLQPWRRYVTVATIFLLILAAWPVYRYLFQQDHATLAAAHWARENTKSEDVILFRPMHHWAMMDYAYNPTLAHYSRRPTFVWTAFTSPELREAALARAKYAIVTLPQRAPGGIAAFVNRFRNTEREVDPLDWLNEAGFVPAASTAEFTAFARR